MTASSQTFTALVLAGRRGPADPLARVARVTHRALLEIGGVPMLVRVIRALRAVPRVARIVVSIDDAAVVAQIEELGALQQAGLLGVHAAGVSPSASVLDFLEARPEADPVLVTTADHALLTADMLAWFCRAAEASEGADLVVGTVRASLVYARYPESRRTVIRFRDGAITGANLYAFRRRDAARAAAFWMRAEQYRKCPWRLISLFGPVALARFALGRLDSEAALARVSRVVGTHIAAVSLPFAEGAIDVDDADDLALATRILAARDAATPAPGAPV